MGIIRLTLFTALALGGAFVWLGRDEGLPEDRIGRAPNVHPEDIEVVSFAAARPTDVTPDMTDTGQQTSANDEVTHQEPQPVALTVQSDTAPAANAAIEAAVQSATAPQVREIKLYVTGSKVNVRGGPSTSYGVIASLKRGEEVVDMGDAGQGWRTIKLANGERGYMADRFLNEARP